VRYNVRNFDTFWALFARGFLRDGQSRQNRPHLAWLASQMRAGRHRRLRGLKVSMGQQLQQSKRTCVHVWMYCSMSQACVDSAVNGGLAIVFYLSPCRVLKGLKLVRPNSEFESSEAGPQSGGIVKARRGKTRETKLECSRVEA
jgi:hypothetical protein